MSLLDFDAAPDRYAVMGNPIAHSKSPAIHARFAEQTGERLVYEAILVDRGGFAQAVGNFQAAGGRGLNVTVPFKQEAWELVDERGLRAEKAGAVNTIKMRDDGSLYGDNTDGTGMVCDIRDNHGATISGQRILLLGAGGAVRGVLGPLLAEGPAEVVIANRTVDKAETLAVLFADEGRVSASGYAQLEGRFDMVINGTSASLQGELPPLADGLLGDTAFCYDMMYGAEPTAFVRWAESQGGRGVDGLGMLVEQAAESFLIWRGLKPETAPVIAALRQAL